MKKKNWARKGFGKGITRKGSGMGRNKKTVLYKSKSSRNGDEKVARLSKKAHL
jgi:hypothetical protein